MRVIECSMCRRRAAWLIERELFCEVHKEGIVQEAGVDRFLIRRLTRGGTSVPRRGALLAADNQEERSRQKRWPKPCQFTLNP
jgi:hypothetical protein